MTPDDLLARESIRDLVTRYNSYADTGRFDHLWDLFAEDAVMEVGPASGERVTYDGRESIKRIFTGAQDRVRRQVDTGGTTYVRHFVATHQIDLIDAEHATGRCYFAVLLPGGLDHWCRYIDEYVRIDGNWRFHRRRVYVDGRVETSWFTG